jgi:hypothetical protein
VVSSIMDVVVRVAPSARTYPALTTPSRIRCSATKREPGCERKRDENARKHKKSMKRTPANAGAEKLSPPRPTRRGKPLRQPGSQPAQQPFPLPLSLVRLIEIGRASCRERVY